MDFVESIQSEGNQLRARPDGRRGDPAGVDHVEVDAENPDKGLDALDIPIPRLTRRFHRDFKSLDAFDPAALGNPRLPIKPFTEEETREIVFKMILDVETHSDVAFFARQFLKELRLVGGYDVLYGKVKIFVRRRDVRGPVRAGDGGVRSRSRPQEGLFRQRPRIAENRSRESTGTAMTEEIENAFGMKCPQCGASDAIDVCADVWVRLCSDGTDVTAAENGDTEWTDHSGAKCCACGFGGHVSDFSKARSQA